MAAEDIYMKMKIDTSGFNTSLQGMKKEMMALKGLVGNNLLSKEDQQIVLTRLGDIKGGMEDLQLASKSMDMGDTFSNIAQVGSLAANSIGGITAAMGIMGVESKMTEDIQKKLMMTIQLSMTLQSLADAKRLKGMVVMRAQQLAELLTFTKVNASIAAQTLATGALGATQAATATSTSLLTRAQLAWNAAIAANPIGLLITAVAALVVGIGALVTWMNNSSEAAKDMITATNNLKESMVDWGKEIDNLVEKNIELKDELKVMNGEMTQSDADRAKAKREYLKLMEELDKVYVENLKKLYAADYENKALFDTLKKKLDTERQKNNEVLWSNYITSLEKINKKESTEYKKTQVEKTKTANEELKKRTDQEFQHRQTIIKAEYELKKLLQENTNTIAKENILERLSKNSEKAFQSFSDNSKKLYDEFKSELVAVSSVLDLTVTEGMETSNEGIKSRTTVMTKELRKASVELIQLKQAFNDMPGEKFKEELGLYNTVDYKTFLEKLNEYRITYYQQLRSSVALAENEQTNILKTQNQQRKDNFQEEQDIQYRSYVNDLNSKKITQKQFDDLTIQMFNETNAKKLISDTTYGTELKNIRKQTTDDIDKLNKEEIDNKFKYSKQSILDMVDINRIGIEKIDEALSKTMVGSKRYNELIQAREILLNKNIEAYKLLQTVMEREVNAQTDMTDEEKLRTTALLWEEIAKKIKEAKDEIDKPKKDSGQWFGDMINLDAWKDPVKSLKENMGQLTQQAASTIMSIMDANLQAQAAMVDEYVKNTEALYDKEVSNYDIMLKQNLITQEQYDKKITTLEETKNAKVRVAKEEQFKREQDAAITTAIIQGALAIVQAYGQLGPIGGTIAAVLIAAVTAAEIGVISSQPVPEYAKGGYIEGPSHKEGGVTMSTPSGQVELEGGEYVIRKDVVKNTKVKKVLEKINNNDKNVIETINNDVIGGLDEKTKLEKGGLITDSKSNKLEKGGLITDSKSTKLEKGGLISNIIYEKGGLISKTNDIKEYSKYVSSSMGRSINTKVFENGGYLDFGKAYSNSISINKESVSQPVVNNNYTTTMDVEELKSVIREIASIPVVVSETDITKTQKKVSVIEKRASW